MKKIRKSAYPANRTARGTWKVEENIFLYQFRKPGQQRYTVKIKRANGNWSHEGICDSLSEAIARRDAAIAREASKARLQSGGVNGDGY